MKKVPVDDCRLKIAATETLETWKKMEKELSRTRANKMDGSGDKELSGGPWNHDYHALYVSISGVTNIRYYQTS